MPYKAIDPLIDALAQHLQRLRNIEVARLLPKDAGILAKLFPVLMGVEEIRRAPQPALDHLDSLAVRRRAAEALRDLLCALALRDPLVLFIDDVQWVCDADSAAILQQVLSSPTVLLCCSLPHTVLKTPRAVWSGRCERPRRPTSAIVVVEPFRIARQESLRRS